MLLPFIWVVTSVFFSLNGPAATTFWFLKWSIFYHFFSVFPYPARFARMKNTSKFRARSARLVSKQIWLKNTFLGLLVRRYENQKTFPLVFSSSCVLSPRAARRNFRFFPGIFLLKRSPDEVRGDWKSKILEIKSLSGHLRRGFAVTTRKKKTLVLILS